MHIGSVPQQSAMVEQVWQPLSFLRKKLNTTWLRATIVTAV